MPGKTTHTHETLAEHPLDEVIGVTEEDRVLGHALYEVLRDAYPVPNAVRVAELRHGAVILEGRVSTTEQRDAVLDRVREVPGVRHVENHIHIRPNKPEGSQGRHRSGADD